MMSANLETQLAITEFAQRVDTTQRSLRGGFQTEVRRRRQSVDA